MKCFAELLKHRDFENCLPGLVAYDMDHDGRVEAVTRSIVAIATLS